jgi:hypothetical protein
MLILSKKVQSVLKFTYDILQWVYLSMAQSPYKRRTLQAMWLYQAMVAGEEMTSDQRGRKRLYIFLVASN